MKKGEKEGRNNFFLTNVFTVVIATFWCYFPGVKNNIPLFIHIYGEVYVHLFIYGF